MGKKGFTLIELMIVVCIIGILSAVAIPQFAAMVRKSKEGTTKGNLATMRASISLFYTDHEGQYPLDDLAGLVPTYLTRIPWKDTPPYHPAGNSVSAGSLAAMTTDRRDWFYDNDPTETEFGHLFVNCEHADLKGIVWSAY